MKDALAAFGLIVLAEFVWMYWCMNQASNDPDVTLGGAYCTMWMLGIPVVAAGAMVAYLIASWFIDIRTNKNKPAPPNTSDLLEKNKSPR